MILLKDFEQSYPGCWRWVEHVRDGKGKNLPDWDDLVYIPLTGTNEILRSKYNSMDTNVSCLYAALASWRQYKEIYSFSPELVETLFAQADEDIVIPNDILRCMPYQCIFITTEPGSGFFVFWEQDMKTMEFELRFCVIDDQNKGNGEPHFDILNFWLHLFPGATIGDGIRRGAEIIKGNVKLKHMEYAVPLNSDEVYDFLTPIVSKLIQLVLYICADNAEVEESPKTKPYTRKPAPGTPPKDVFREIRTWDVGVKFASKVKKAREASHDAATPAEYSAGTGSPKRPHTRRGHWHHYWTGSDRDNTKKLILKWTAPIFVGGDHEDTIITTINEL